MNFLDDFVVLARFGRFRLERNSWLGFGCFGRSVSFDGDGVIPLGGKIDFGRCRFGLGGWRRLVDYSEFGFGSGLDRKSTRLNSSH